MKLYTLLFLLLIFSFSSMANDEFIYLGQNCVNVSNSDLPYANKKFSDHVEDISKVVFSLGTKKPQRKYDERPMRDGFRHLQNPDREWKTKFHFEKDYLSSSGYQSGGYLQFWQDNGIVVKKETCHLGLVGIGLENQKGDNPILLVMPNGEGYIRIEPKTSCLFYFKAADRTKEATFYVYTQGSPYNVFQKVYHNNNMHGDFLKNNYLSNNYSGDMIPLDWFHFSSWDWYAKYILGQ